MAKDKNSKPKHKYTIPEILVGLVLFTALFAGLIGAVTGSSETSKSDIAIGEKNDPYRMEVTPTPEERIFYDCPNFDLNNLNRDYLNGNDNERFVELIQVATEQLLDKSEKNVEYCATLKNLIYRVTARDGEFFLLTKDYSPNRINVEINKGFITKITFG